MDQLAGHGALVALGRLQAKAAQATHPDSRQDPRDRRQRPLEDLGDLRAGKPQAAQRGDRLDRVLVRAVGHDHWRRGTIEQATNTLGPVTGHPL
jgi:hypothetical protein